MCIVCLCVCDVNVLNFIRLSLSSAGVPLPFRAHPSRSPARSSPASVVPVRDGRFLWFRPLYYLEHCLNSLVVVIVHSVNQSCCTYYYYNYY